VWRRKTDAVVLPYRDVPREDAARLAEVVTAAIASLGAEAIERGGPAAVAAAVNAALLYGAGTGIKPEATPLGSHPLPSAPTTAEQKEQGC
jgi:hypothetical protein